MTFYFILFYAVIVLAFIVYSIAGIYHLWRFGYSGDLSKYIITVYVFLSFIIIAGSVSLIAIKLFS